MRRRVWSVAVVSLILWTCGCKSQAPAVGTSAERIPDDALMVLSITDVDAVTKIFESDPYGPQEFATWRSLIAQALGKDDAFVKAQMAKIERLDYAVLEKPDARRFLLHIDLGEAAELRDALKTFAGVDQGEPAGEFAGEKVWRARPQGAEVEAAPACRCSRSRATRC